MQLADIVTTLNTYGLPHKLVMAIISKESSGNTWAWNPEPKYRYFWDVKKNAPFRKVTDAEVASKFPPKDFPSLQGDPDNEWWAQQASWGVMQIMGACAREMGCTAPYLTELNNPMVGIQYALRLLSRYRDKYLAGGGWDAVCRAYNGGPAAVQSMVNQASYADIVKKLCGGSWPS